MQSPEYTKKGVLEQLDLAGSVASNFLCFDNGQVYPIECRLSAYRDSQYWAIVIEEVVFSPRATAQGHHCILLWIYSHGNCMRGKVPFWGGRVVEPTSNGPEGDTFVFRQFPYWEHLRKGIRSIRIRGQVAPIETNPEAYEEMGIKLLDPPRIKGHELLRGLPLKYRQMLLGTEEELRGKFKVAARPELILRLDEWHHPRILREEKPSQSEAFQMIADVLVTGEPSLYRPTVLPNTHWSNWPKAGILERPVEPE